MICWRVIAHNIRSAYNVGGIFRTADGAGAGRIYLSGYTPLPQDERSLYATSAQRMIAKTALGAERMVSWEKVRSISLILAHLQKEGWQIVALERHPKSVALRDFTPRGKFVLLLGNEPRGLDSRLLRKCDAIVEIPMFGKKSSLNVVVAFGVAGYALGGGIFKR